MLKICSISLFAHLICNTRQNKVLLSPLGGTYMQTIEVKVSEKITLSLKEAVALTGIGEKKLIQMSKMPGCTFIVYVGAKRMFKRRKLEEYLEASFST